MKKFIKKSSFFVLPFLMVYILNVLLYKSQDGDLARIGYLYFNPSPNRNILKQYNLKKQYTELSEIDLNKNYKFDVITIGDSFSEQGSLGYKNFLAQNDLKILHVNRFISANDPMKTLIQLLNSDFFEHIEANYVVLQSAGRLFNIKNKNINFDLSIELDSISKMIESYEKLKRNNSLQLFSDALFKIPITNIQYIFEPKPIFSQTYKFSSTNPHLFTNDPDDILIFENDIKNIQIKNDSLAIMNSIEVIEGINKKMEENNMDLIMLVSPDKYDLYYPYIENKDGLIEPSFYKIYDSTPKEYKNIAVHSILSEAIKSEKDIYFYDDSHWSPKGAKLIADEIYKIIINEKITKDNNGYK